MNLPLAHSLALSLHSTHPLSCRFLAGLNESFPTRCGRSCGMPFLLENRPKTVKKISRGTAPDPLSLPISGRAPPRQSGPLAERPADICALLRIILEKAYISERNFSGCPYADKVRHPGF